jgi:hemolysin activation/secretion protein
MTMMSPSLFHKPAPVSPGRGLLAAACLLALSNAWSQTPPDAGRLLQQDRAVPQQPAAPPTLAVAPPAKAPLLTGGSSVLLKRLRFSGNTAFSDAQLTAALGLPDAPRLDMAGLQALADRISEHYRSQGYAFARAYLPAQRLDDGTLQITVLEGRYGLVETTGDAALATPAQAFLSTLKPGDPITSAALERATLVLSDQPGIEIRPVVRPGQAVGSGDLMVEVRATPRWRGDLGLDNHGSRYTGSVRASASLTGDRVFRFGDQLLLKALYSEADQWLGHAGYSLPLGGGGWRAQASHAHTGYQLGKQFASLQASGSADISSIGLSYPWLRSRQTNLSLVLSPQYKRLKDDQASTQSRSRKRSEVLPLSLQFDHRDTLGGGALTYGNLSLSAGRLKLDDTLRAADSSTARTEGSFRKLMLDVARQQLTPVPGLSLYGRLSAQWASKNLDSSEDFGLGGPSGVRAYPSGEGFGDEGTLLQLELRYSLGAFAPYLFADHGRTQYNHHAWAAGDTHRELSGGGVGLRHQQGPWAMDAALAWRAQGGQPSSDSSSQDPRLWVQASWRF